MEVQLVIHLERYDFNINVIKLAFILGADETTAATGYPRSEGQLRRAGDPAVERLVPAQPGAGLLQRGDLQAPAPPRHHQVQGHTILVYIKLYHIRYM